MSNFLRDQLENFSKDKKFQGKGPLSVALVITQHAKEKGLPLNPDKLITKGKGQVLGLGGGAVRKILRRHGINRILASEGGRTSRGSIRNMRDYVTLLNALNTNKKIDLEEIENFWVQKVEEYFAGQPFKIKLDPAKSLQTMVRDIIKQAIDRQKKLSGMNCAGAVLQHLIGAKLDCALGRDTLQHSSFSTADAPKSRHGDFSLGDVAIHVTTSPGEAVIARCKENLSDGVQPVLVTLKSKLSVAEGLANNANVEERIDMFDVEQFVVLNLYEFGRFEGKARKIAITDFITRYNEIIDKVETDPSLKIELRR